MNNLPESAILLIDGNAGIYVPYSFAVSYALGSLDEVDQESFDILKHGPDHDEYWEAWETVLDTCYLRGEQGGAYYLYHDCDLWAIPVGTDAWED
jgi:hypothetical protein